MARSKSFIRPPPRPVSLQRRAQCARMTASSHLQVPDPAPRMEHEAVDLTKEIRHIERDTALHSEAPSCAKDGRTQAHDEQPGTQGRDKAKTGKLTTSRTHRQRSTSTKKIKPRRKDQFIAFSKEIHDLEIDIAIHSDIPSCAKDGRRALKRAAASHRSARRASSPDNSRQAQRCNDVHTRARAS